MNFNSAEWIAAATFDLFLRVTCSVLASFHILLIPLAFKISLIHLALLGSTSVLLRAFVRKPISSGLAAVLITNIVFAFIFISTWILLIKEGSQTVCYGVEPKCVGSTG